MLNNMGQVAEFLYSTIRYHRDQSSAWLYVFNAARSKRLRLEILPDDCFDVRVCDSFTVGGHSIYLNFCQRMCEWHSEKMHDAEKQLSELQNG